jgi:hypothetical protein
MTDIALAPRGNIALAGVLLVHRALNGGVRCDDGPLGPTLDYVKNLSDRALTFS